MKQYATILGCSVVSGILFCLCLPLGEQAYLAPVAFAPLFASVRKTRFVVGFVAALVTIFVAAKLSETGVFYREKFFSADANAAWIYSGYGLFGVPVALVAALFAEPKLDKAPFWLMGFAAILAERSLEFYLPAHLALSQYRSGGMLLFASVFGIYGVSLLLWLTNFWLARQRTTLWPILVPVVCLATFALARIQLPPQTGKTIKVAVLQAPVDDDALIEKTMLEAKRRGVELTVWPEFGGIIFGAGTDPVRLRQLSLDTVPLVTSFPDSSTPKPFNMASLFCRGTESDRYAKQHLFGGEAQQHQGGDKEMTVPFGQSKLGLMICFDSCYQDLARRTARKGANLIALPTIDPQSPHHFLAAIHASFGSFRSAETGVPLLRADAYAHSMVTDSRGRILLEAGTSPGLYEIRVSTAPSWPFFKQTNMTTFLMIALFPILTLLFVRAPKSVTATEPE